MTYTQTTQAHAHDGQQARLGPNHGYRIAGDVACLNAELALGPVAEEALAQQWALQLWACDQPYIGGELNGVKIAEAPVDILASGRVAQPQHLYAETFARLPAGDGEYAMVMVLAARDGSARESVYDFANYPAREHFNVPTLRGNVSYAVEPGHVVLRVQSIENPRSAENLSGTLALELWALEQPYRGGQFTGTPVAGVELGRLAGQGALGQIEQRLSAALPREARHLSLMLREWTEAGYVSRDYRNFVVEPARVEAVAAPAPAPIASARPAPASPAQVAKPAASPASLAQGTKAEPPAAAAPAGLVSIQHATVDQLAAVPGLNRKLAQEIVKARPFKRFDDLTRVRGVGDKTLRKLRSVLTL